MGQTVLIVDDSKLARMSVARALNALHPDWARVEATNGDEALAAMADGAVDVALLDFNMPGRDGLTIAAEMRATRPDMPIALISANTQTEVIDRAKAVGAVFLAKPLSEQALGAFLASVGK